MRSIPTLSQLVLCLVFMLTSLHAETPGDYGAPEVGRVRIVRDTYGVPHIIARDNRSLFFGVGYSQAEDQLENLAMNYLRSKGRASEREGMSELQIDVLIQSMQIPQRAREVFAKLDPETRGQWEGFAAGVNHYIQQKGQQIPEWIERVEPQDVIGFAMYIETMFSMSYCRNDLVAGGVKLSQNVPAANFGLEYGSNQFAVSPKRSSTGACMLSMDPHLRLSSFFRWYEMHLVGPEINAMGACFFGSPYVSMGRTEQTAWCMTVNGPDLGDVFTFQVNPEDPTQYKGINGWQKFDMSVNTFKVKRADGFDQQTLPTMRTEVGPVVALKDGIAYVFALPTLNDASRANQMYNMMRATTMPEFRDALKPLGLVMFNILYADKHGDIFYISNGRVPKRDTRIASDKFRPGDQAWARWQGFHPIEELPQVTNPSAGFILNTNSGPQGVTPDGAPDLKDFPAYMNNHEANSRSRRLDHLLRNDQSLTFEEMKTYATDTMVEVDEQYLAKVYAIAEQDAGNETELLRTCLSILKKWDRRTDLESRGAILFHLLASDRTFNAAVNGKESAATLQAFVKVAKQVQQQFGSIDAPWKEFSRIRRGDIEIGVAGSGGVGSRAGAALCPTNGEIRDGKRYCAGGSSYGMIVDFSGKTQAISCLPFGVSEDPSSPYFANMMTLYADRQFKPAWFFPDEIKANTKNELTLITLE